jgi:FdrA protein
MIESLVRKNAYYDSVTLMLASRELKELDGVEEVLVGMGTDLNLDLVRNLDMMTPDLEALSVNDLFIVARFDESKTSIAQLAEAFEQSLNKKATESDGAYQPPTLKSALEHLPGANLVQISIPGRYAAAEVEDALDAGLHVMLFSDNVSEEDERRLKQKAVEKGLLLMGPDCGTAIINGVPLCFANAVKRGKIGIVGASGTGTQEVSTQIDKLGEGLSQVIGTGGRDLKESIGGLMMLQGFEALIADPQTEVIVLISKPPAASVAEKIYARAKTSPKPVVIDFIGGDAEAIRAAGAIPCLSFEDAAAKAVALVRGEELADRDGISLSEAELKDLIQEQTAVLKEDQVNLLGLYTGGTLADEAMKFLGEHYPIYSNIPLSPEMAIDKMPEGKGNIVLDLGEDQFTRGRAHPMIDPQTRTEFFESHITGSTALVLVDVVLGFGSHADPAGALAQSVQKARAKLTKDGKGLIVLGSITGTDQDPQDLKKSTATLKDAGVIVMPSNAQAVRLAGQFMQVFNKGAK